MITNGIDGVDLPALLEAVASVIMALANEAEDRDAIAVALASRDAVEALFVLTDVLAGPAAEALDRL